MSKVQFQVARQYIESGDYDKAREVLHSMNHPSVQKWLEKIDEIDPPFPEGAPLPKQSYHRLSSRTDHLELTDKELRYLKHELERKRSGRIVGLFILGTFIACGSIPVVIRLFNTNFAHPTTFLEFFARSSGLLCILVIVVPLFIYLWNTEI